MIRTIKEEVIWPCEYENAREVKDAIEAFVECYNRYYPRSSLEYLSPLEAKEKYYKMMEVNNADYTNSTRKFRAFKGEQYPEFLSILSWALIRSEK